MFNYHYPHSQTKPVLSKMTSYRAQSDPMDLSVCGRTIAVADMMKGATLLNYKPEEATETQGSFFEIARNYSTQWSTAICLLDEETVVSGDSEGNLLIQKIDKNGVTAEDKRRLRLVGDMRLGEMINRIRRGENASLPGAHI